MIRGCVGMNRRGRPSNKWGFTLVELIVVIAILGILAALIVPNVVGYVSVTKEKACQATMNTLVREYQMDIADQNPQSTTEAQAIFAEIMKSHGGESVSTNGSFYTAGSYSGFCKDKGVYNCIFAPGNTVLTIECSEHGGQIMDIKTLQERLAAITFDFDTHAAGSKYKTLDDYFKAGVGRSLDSEAKSVDSTAYAPYSSLAEAVSAKLNEQGINTTGRSWRMEKPSGSYKLYLTDNQKVKMDDVKNETEIACTFYDVAKGEVVHGTIKVKKGDGDYPVLDSKSFTPDQVD